MKEYLASQFELCSFLRMSTQRFARDALNRARTAAGGSSALARALEISPQAVLQWKVVPAERVLDVERATKITRYDLRPDVFGPAPEVTS